ncbi:MAG: histidinol-phosphate aminotransferase family protein [Candidatus Thermoplasmatota archaeon]|nr:histidinol-phosphate aminotransferase family protein [Candidatus Thermoplasmatota archaeon]
MKSFSTDHDAFRHGDQFFMQSSALDFSASINPESTERKKITIDPENLSHYPLSPSLIESRISSYLGLKQENIMAFYGLTALIHHLFRFFNSMRGLLLEPLFAEHMRAALLSNMNISRVPVNTVMEVPSLIRSFNPDVISLNSPVNPTGEHYGTEKIEKLLMESEKIGAYVFIDEAYADFVKKDKTLDYKFLLDRYSNFICGRTLTKATGLPGVRIGYAIAPPEIIIKMKRMGIPWMIPQFYSEIIDSLLEIGDLKWIEDERNYLETSFRDMGIIILGKPEANFISFRITDKEIKEYFSIELRNRGFLVRDISNFYGFMQGDFRVTVRKHGDNEKLVHAIKEILG